MLLVFDTRQTKGPLHSLSGLSTIPVHTIHSVVDDSGSTKIISASSIGPCIWDVDGSENRYLPAQKLLPILTMPMVFGNEDICNGNVSELRMSKSAILPCSGTDQRLFAYGDESLRGVRTWRLPSFQPLADLRPHRQPILDLRFAESSTGEKYLGCLSEEKLLVFRIRS